MVRYGRKRSYGRRRKYLSKTYVKSRKGRTSQSNQIMSLQRQIKSIARKVSDRTQYTQFQIAHSEAAISHLIAPNTLWQPSVFIPIQPATWTPIFQSEPLSGTASENYGNKFRGRSIGFEHMIQIATEGGTTPITCTLMCVSLRKEVALQVIQDTNELTDFTQANRSYVLSTLGAVQGAGMVMINKGYFNVRYLKRFMLGTRTDFISETNTTNIKDNNKRIYVRLSYPNLIKSGRGDVMWKELQPDEVEATDHLIWLLFHNAYGTQAISWNVNTVITGRQTN